MKYSYNWIQSHIKEKLPAPDVLRETIVFHAFEVESIEQAGVDVVLDIKVLPDRAGDCLSHGGMAREIAGLLNFTYIEKPITPIPAVSATIPVDISETHCSAYTAIRIDGVAVGPSPAWLQEALTSIGQRSINAIVDATNYVLFDVGQPVHAFDAAKVDGGIVVRAAHAGETIKLLGGEEKTLQESDMVIADYIGALAIAGVKGGITAEVGDTTTSIIVEVAHFDPVAVRKTSRRLGLITDASKRFENNISSAIVPYAAAQVISLILELAGGTVSAVTVAGTTTVPEKTITFTTADIARILGTSITASDISAVFDRYGYSYETSKDSYTLSVPSWRFDITGAHDIAEEVGRVIGYDRIPPLPLPAVISVEQNDTDEAISAVRAWATAQGYREVYTYAFRPKGEVSIAYGAKGKDKLRTNLSDGLKESYELNRLHAPLLAVQSVKLFEIGTVFSHDGETLHVAVCDKGTIQELPLAEFVKHNDITIPASIDTAAVLDSPHPFVAWSSFPFITRDIAVWVSTDADKERLATMLHDFAKQHCVREPYLFDTFAKDNRTSVAYRLVFQSFDSTLTDEAVSSVYEPFLATIAADPSFEIR